MRRNSAKDSGQMLNGSGNGDFLLSFTFSNSLSQIRDIVGYFATSRVDFCKIGRIGTTVTGGLGNMLNGS
jgi:hypothetical protein